MHLRPTLKSPGLMAFLLATALAACSTLGTAALFGDEVAFTAPQLQAQLDRRFPRDYDKLDGLLTLRVANPRLSLPPGEHRLRLEFDIGIGALGRDASPSGHMAIASGLRFDAATRSLQLDQPALENADFPQLGGALGTGARALANRWLEDYARNEPLYEFDHNLLERIGARRIDSTSIDNGRIVLHLGH